MVAPSGSSEAAASVGGIVAAAGTARRIRSGAAASGGAGTGARGRRRCRRQPASWMLSKSIFDFVATWFSSTKREEVSSLAGTALPRTTSCR